MRSISEKKLKDLYRKNHSKIETSFMKEFFYGKCAALSDAICECKELQEPWIPVDENAPKDRFILCWIDDLQSKYILKFSTIRNTWLDQGLRPFMKPDLYQELPDDPV